MSKTKCGRPPAQQNLIRRWRKIRGPNQRLYWRCLRNSIRFPHYFDRGVVAVIRNRTSWTQFFTLDALEEYIISIEELAKESEE